LTKDLKKNIILQHAGSLLLMKGTQHLETSKQKTAKPI
jgi:hypothetical protein